MAFHGNGLLLAECELDSLSLRRCDELAFVRVAGATAETIHIADCPSLQALATQRVQGM